MPTARLPRKKRRDRVLMEAPSEGSPIIASPAVPLHGTWRPVDFRGRPISEWPSRMRQKGLDFGEAAAPRPARRRALTVSELTERIQGVLETEFVDVWVEGEVSNLKLAASGHWYFSLKDDQAQVRAVVWKTDARLIRFRPKDGMKVLARGAVRVYAPRGEYQISVQVLEPLGKGSLQQAFEELKDKLEKEGLFDPARKRPLPDAPAADRGRDLARPAPSCATSCASCARATRTSRCSSTPLACRARTPPPRSRRASARSTASGAST